MASKVQSVKGIPCLYCYAHKLGDVRYFIKVQCKNQIFRKDLDVPEDVSYEALKQIAMRAVLCIKKRHGAERTFRSYVEEYCDMHQLAPKTTKAYLRTLKDYSFDEEHNEALLRETMDSGINCCQRSRIVGSFFDWLHRKNIRIANPTANIRIPKAGVRTRTLSHDEVCTYYTELAKLDQETALFGRLLLETGGRVGTICSIRVCDVHKEGLSLRNIKAQRDYFLPIPMPETTRTLCEKLMHNKPPMASLFSTCTSTLIYRLRKLLDRLFNPLGTRERIVIHSLRHTTASHAIQAGVPLEIVSRMLDHINVNTTYRVYAKLNKIQLNQGFSALFKALNA